jgi:hypothetical protein
MVMMRADDELWPSSRMLRMKSPQRLVDYTLVKDDDDDDELSLQLHLIEDPTLVSSASGQ